MALWKLFWSQKQLPLAAPLTQSRSRSNLLFSTELFCSEPLFVNIPKSKEETPDFNQVSAWDPHITKGGEEVAEERQASRPKSDTSDVDSVTENPGIKPRNTNVVLKGRHSLLRRRMHGGYFRRTCIPHTLSVQFI